MNELISVIVPIYKVEDYLDRCVESIVNQTYRNLEIILVDDGSPDGGPQKCDEWAERDGRVKVIHKENGGVSSARNAGLKAMTGKYVTFVDPDDFVSKQYCQVLLETMLETNADFVHCKCNRDTYTSEMEGVKIKVNDETFFPLHEETFFMSVWGGIYKREIIIRNRLLFHEDIAVWEDVCFNFQYYLACENFIGLYRSLYNYTLRSGSALMSKWSPRQNTSIEAFQRMQLYAADRMTLYSSLSERGYCSAYVLLTAMYGQKKHIEKNIFKKYKKYNLSILKQNKQYYLKKHRSLKKRIMCYLSLFFPKLYFPFRSRTIQKYNKEIL